MAVIQTELYNATNRIDPDELSSEGAHSRQGDWIGLSGDITGLHPGRPDFGRSAGLNVETGRLHIGNIQFESPLEGKLDGRHHDWPRVHIGRSLTRNPIIMQLERLARAQIGDLELIDMESDGTPQSMTQRDMDAFTRWEASYQAAVEQSKHGKPRIEKFYDDNDKGLIWPHLRSNEIRVLFGSRIHALLRPGR